MSEPDPAEARQRFTERLGAAGLSVVRFIDVANGTKASHNHLLHGPDDGIEGNYGIYAGAGEDDIVDTDGYLIDFDVDDYDDDLDTEVLDRLPETFTVESPHTDPENPGHRYFGMFYGNDPGEIVREVTGDDKDNLVMPWGEIRIKNQYTVGPGSQLDGCEKDWCDACAEPDGGYYRIAADKPIATISEEEFRELLEADQSTTDNESLEDVFDDEDFESTSDSDDADADHTGDAKAVAKANQWINDYLAYGETDDRSETDFAVCRKLIEQDVSESDAHELLNDSAHTKVHGRDLQYWRKTWKNARKKANSTADDGTSAGSPQGSDGDKAGADSDSETDWAERVTPYADAATDRNSVTTLKDARTKAASEAVQNYEFLTPESKGEELNKRPLWIYEDSDGCYERRGSAQIATDLNGTVAKFSTGDQTEVANLVKRDTIAEREVLDAADEDNLLINCETGVYDVDSGEELDHDSNYNFRHVHPFEYDPDATAGPVLDFLEEVVEHEHEVKTLLEFIGYCFEDGYPDPHFLLLYGSGGNGKGIFFDIVEALLGRPNASSVELDQMIGDNRFMLAELDGSFVNIDGDVGSSVISTEELSVIKKLTGQDGIPVQYKYQDPFELRNRAKLMFAANKPPRFHDSTNAIARRFMVVPFPYEFVSDPQEAGEKQRRPYRELMDELTSPEALSGLFNEAMAAYQQVRERGTFTIEEQGSNRERLKAYRRDADPIVGFAHQFIENKQHFAVPKDVIYALYSQYAQDEGEYPADRRVLFRKLGQATDIDIYDARPQLQTSNGKRRIRICDHLWVQASAVEYLDDSARGDIDLIMAKRYPENADYAEDFLGLVPEPEPEPEENGSGDLDPSATQSVALVVQNDPGILFADLRAELGMNHGLDPETAEVAIEDAVKQGKVMKDSLNYRPS